MTSDAAPRVPWQLATATSPAPPRDGASTLPEDVSSVIPTDEGELLTVSDQWHLGLAATSTSWYPTPEPTGAVVSTYYRPFAAQSVPRTAKARLWQEASEDFSRIDVDPGVMGGQPVIRGTRIPIYSIVAHASRGRSAEQIIDHLDGAIDAEDLRQAFLFAAALCRA